MPFPVVCPSCGKRSNAPDNARGKRAKCGKCGTSFALTDVPVETGPIIAAVKDGGFPLQAKAAKSEVNDLLGQLPPVSDLDDLLAPSASNPPDALELDELLGTAANTPALPRTKACPMCGETILETAKKCKHCGEMVDPNSPVARTSGNTKRSHGKEGGKRSYARLLIGGVIGAVLLGAAAILGYEAWSRTAVRRELFEPVYRIATELKAGQEVGINREKFGALLQQFATELAIAQDKAKTVAEQDVCDGYSEVLDTYKDAGAVWDVQIRIPQLLHEADQHIQTIAQGGGDLGESFKKSIPFKGAATLGIPLNLYPAGTSGLGEVVTRNDLPVTDHQGWKTIPKTSVQMLWQKAREKNDEVDKLVKAGSS